MGKLGVRCALAQVSKRGKLRAWIEPYQMEQSFSPGLMNTELTEGNDKCAVEAGHFGPCSSRKQQLPCFSLKLAHWLFLCLVFHVLGLST